MATETYESVEPLISLLSSSLPPALKTLNPRAIFNLAIHSAFLAKDFDSAAPWWTLKLTVSLCRRFVWTSV